jgi:ribose-phosphate pyrophosphokinase
MIRVENVVIQPGNFPDGTLLLKISDKVIYQCEDERDIIIDWLYENDEELFTLICVKRYIDEKFYNVAIHLNMPYIPHARMDRVKNDEDVFTLKYFCEVINSLNFTTVWVCDAHSNVSLALLNNVKEEPIKSFISEAIARSDAEALFFPDEGAMKRYSDYFQMPYAFGMKARDWETGKIVGYDIVHSNNIDGKNVLIVDDICSRGGTFYHAAKTLKEAGAKNIYLYITHCENTILVGELLTSGLIEKVYTTNSIFTKEHEMIEVFNYEN